MWLGSLFIISAEYNKFNKYYGIIGSFRHHPCAYVQYSKDAYIQEQDLTSHCIGHTCNSTLPFTQLYVV